MDSCSVSDLFSMYDIIPNSIVLECPTEVRENEPDSPTVLQPSDWLSTGYVLGLILESAIKKQSDTSHPDPIHVTAHFLRSATTSSPFEVHIQILKPGRGFTNLTANLVQEVIQ